MGNFELCCIYTQHFLLPRTIFKNRALLHDTDCGEVNPFILNRTRTLAVQTIVPALGVRSDPLEP